MNDEPTGPAANASQPGGDPAVERRLHEERRRGERRRVQQPVEVERRSGLDRRQVSDRRRGVNRYELSPEEMEFVHAIQRFKERTGKPFPTWSEVLGILRSLGYEKRA